MGSCFFIFLAGQCIIKKHLILHTIYNGPEKAGRDAGAVEVKCPYIGEFFLRVEFDEFGRVDELHIGEASFFLSPSTRDISHIKNERSSKPSKAFCKTLQSNL